MPDTSAYIQLEIASYFFDFAISFDSAIYYCDQALSMIQENIEGFKRPYLEAWYKKGFYYRKWDKYELSKESLSVVLDASENEFTYDATVQMGKLYKDRGEFALAFKYYQKALELAGSDKKKKIRVYEYISFAYSIMGTKDGARNAIYWLDKLGDAVKQLPDRSYDTYLPLVAYNTGDSYYQLGDLEKAEEYVDEAARLLEECCDDPDFMGLIIDFKGYMDYERGDYAGAIAKYQQGIDLFQYSYDLGRGQGLAGNYYSIAEAYLKWGKLDSALHYANKTIIDRTYGFDNNLELRPFPSIEDMIENGEKAYLIDDLMLKGDILEHMYDTSDMPLDSVIRYFELAEKILDAMTYDHIEEATKIFWRQTAKNVYYQLVRLYLKDGQTTKAFLQSEKSKYVILEEHLRKLEFAAKESTLPLIIEYQGLIDSLRHEEIRFENSKLAFASFEEERNNLIDLRKREDDILNRIKYELPYVHDKLFDWRPPQIAEIRKGLRENREVLIEYFVHDSMSYAFFLSPKDLIVKELGPRAQLIEEVKSFLKSFEPDIAVSQSVSAYQARAFGLYHKLLDSVQIATYPNLVIVPDDALTLLPFELLTTKPTNNAEDFGLLPYMMRHKSIRYVINAKEVHPNNQRLPIDSETAISFVPDFSHAGSTSTSSLAVRNGSSNALTPLTGAVQEIEALCANFACEALNSGVTEELFFNKIEQPKSIIHIATHAIMNDSMPSRSRLVMEQSDGIGSENQVHVFELKNKRIASNLVVLSACNTGVGKIYRGEGLASLGMAFHYAGSPNLVTSLWSIPDQSSAHIIRAFYERLRAGLPKFQALRQAKLDYLDNFPSDIKHPFHWGGMLYYGDALALASSKNETGFPTWILYAIILLIGGIIIFLRFMPGANR